MAVIRAIANGNWNAASTWDLNRIPDVDDDVYLNNHTLSWSGSRAVCHNLYLQNTNDYFSTTFQITANHIFINITTSAFRYGVNCIGDIDISGGQISGAGGAVDITGNILLTNGATLLGNVSGASYANCTINGNISVENGATLRISGSSHRNFTVNGTITIEETVTSAIYTVSTQGWGFYATRILNKSTYTLIIGTLAANYVFEVGELISPNAYVFNTLQSRPIRIGIADVLNIYNISHPITINSLTTHTLSFPIIEGIHVEENIISNPNANLKVYTVAQTTYLQPNEDEVKKDVIYDGGNRIGTYTPDYPPESVVLKDYEYDNGNKTGTLNIPSTSDIVTAIKSDSDLGGKIASTDTNVSDIKSRLGSVNSGTIGSVVDTINTNTQQLSTDLAVVDGNIDIIVSRLTQNLVDRLGSSVTVQLLQQVLDAHLND